MLATNHDTVANHFIHQTNAKAGRRFRIYGKEMNECKHFHLRLLDLMADSAARQSYYPNGRRPFKGHLSVDMDQPSTLLSGIEAEVRAVAETSSLVAASSPRTINESGQAVLARVFGVTSDASQWRRELRPAEVREMAMLPDLWRNPQLMMAWALKRGVFKFELQWREFIATSSKQWLCRDDAQRWREGRAKRFLNHSATGLSRGIWWFSGRPRCCGSGCTCVAVACLLLSLSLSLSLSLPLVNHVFPIYCMTEYTTNLVFFKCYYIVK